MRPNLICSARKSQILHAPDSDNKERVWLWTQPFSSLKEQIWCFFTTAVAECIRIASMQAFLLESQTHAVSTLHCLMTPVGGILASRYWPLLSAASEPVSGVTMVTGDTPPPTTTTVARNNLMHHVTVEHLDEQHYGEQNSNPSIRHQAVGLSELYLLCRS